jgi:predicted negative regulator of RcsB-dependent stress response
METDPTVALYKFIPWFQENRKVITIVGAAVAVIAIVIGYSNWKSGENEADANMALMAVPSLLVQNSATDSPPAGKLLAVANEYPGTSAGAVAQLLAARSLYLEDKFPEAQSAFNKFITDNPNSPLVPQAKVCVAEALEAQGKTNEAIQEYKTINTLYASMPNIVMPVKLTLGRLSEAEKPAQSVTYYSELASIKDPRDPWVAEATERLRLLFAKHPELNPNREQPQAPGVAAPSVMAPSTSEMQLMAPPANTAPPSPSTNPPPK